MEDNKLNGITPVDDGNEEQLLNGSDAAQAQEAAAESAEDVTQDAEVQEENEVNEEPANALEAELESIADMFRVALDNGGVLPGEEETQDENEEKEVVLCSCCGERPVAEEFGEDNTYCEVCRHVMLHSRFGFKGILTVLVAFVLSFAALYFSFDQLESYLYALDAHSLQAESKLYDAYSAYGEYMSSVSAENVGKKVAVRAAKLYTALGYFSDANTIADTYFTSAQKALPPYNYMKKVKAEHEEFEVTYNTVYALVSEPLTATNPEDIDYKGLIAQLDELKEADPREADESVTLEKYDDFIIEYYKYIIMLSANRPLEEQYEQLLIVEQVGKDDLWAYGSTMCDVAGKLGNTEKSKEYFDKMTAFNANDVLPYVAYAQSIRFSEEPDADAILELMGTAAEIGTQAEVYRMTAIAYLMKGDYQTACESAMTAYEYCSYSGYTFQTIYTLAVSAIANEDTELYNQVKTWLEGYGYTMSEDVEAYVNGEIKLEDLIFDAQGDLA